MALRQSLCRGERGAELIEFALVLPLFLFVTAGIVDFGFVFQQYNVVTNAAREGARLAAVPNSTRDAVQNRVNAYVKAGGLMADPTTEVAPVNIATVPGGPVYRGVRVKVSYPCQFMVVGALASFFGGPLGAPTLHAQATMRHESQ
jgi:Flp pilus assembly protein TadG